MMQIPSATHFCPTLSAIISYLNYASVLIWMRGLREKSDERGKLIRRYFIVLGVDDLYFREKSDGWEKLIRHYFIV